MAAWNGARLPYPIVACVPQLVAAQAAATPDAVALREAGRPLSYMELDQRANQLAHNLQAIGVGPDVLVGCCLDRSLDMVVAMLGILKAGGAYVPLDPAYPRERLTTILNDARVPVLVTHRDHVTWLSPLQARVVRLDADEAALGNLSTLEPASAVSAGDLAYVIYTSGSTGIPKGVQITHRGLLNLVFWHQRTFAVTPSDRATQLSSPAFDATGWELWPYLTIGASVDLAEDDVRLVPELLRDWLVSRGITVSFVPTPVAERLMGLEWPQTTALRLLLTGADTLHRYPSPTLPFAVINNYGPTEATVVATSGLVPPTADPDTPPSIGRPIANTQIYILDDDLRRVPVGAPGELCIGGDGLARGYLNRPDLTAEKFIPDPFSDEPGARLYRSGDLARIRPDGQIAFLGRTDLQVKIRGYRIELDEIATLLDRHPSIQVSVVVVREDNPGDKRLVAYLIPVPGANPTAGVLRDALASRLPDYMIPSAFVVLESQPLTPNGKVDRAGLPAPDAENTLRDGATAAPGTLVEERLVEIMASLLHVGRIGIDDNFFLLGGNSLMGAQLVVRTAEAFGVELPLRTLFARPTVRQLAVEIESRIVARVESMSDDEARQELGARV